MAGCGDGLQQKSAKQGQQGAEQQPSVQSAVSNRVHKVVVAQLTQIGCQVQGLGATRLCWELSSANLSSSYCALFCVISSAAAMQALMQVAVTEHYSIECK